MAGRNTDGSGDGPPASPGPPPWIRIRESGVEVRIRLIPNASRDGVAGLYGDRLKVRLTALPVAGAANEALVRFLSRAVRVAPSSIRIVQGQRDRSKTVLITTDSALALARRLVMVLR